jgi:hypothetical protein
MEKGTGMAMGIGIGVMMGAIFGGMGLWIAGGVILGVLIENGELDHWDDMFSCRSRE